MKISRRKVLALAAASPLLAQSTKGKTVFIVPNFHPASCGWLTNFSKERVYCANTYFDHLDRVRDDPEYAFVLSEVNNIIAMMNFQPRRNTELLHRIREGRVELVNGFFLESTVNLSGGEALIRLGVEGLRWQKAVFGVRPRFAWTIDVCGTHDQMAQISAGLGLEAMVYTRKNPTGSALHWAESPDGTRVLAVSPGHYSELSPVMAAKEPLTPKQFEDVERFFAGKLKVTPEGAPVLVLAGNGDYALAPLLKEYPKAFLAEWRRDPARPDVRFATLGQYIDAVMPDIRAGRVKIPTMRGGTAYDFDAFWIQNPRIKTGFRKNEHALQAAEILATAASLKGGYEYPAATLYHAWLQVFLNMDRNTLWGAAGGMVFQHEKSWDALDRMESVAKLAAGTLASAGKSIVPEGSGIAIFNPLNWKRNDPILLSAAIEGTVCEDAGGSRVLSRLELPATGVAGFARSAQPPAAPRKKTLPAVIETKHYQARIDPNTGALVSLKLRASGREMLGGAANVIVAEKPIQQRGDPGDFILPRPGRVRLESSNLYPPTIAVYDGPIATTVQIDGKFFGGGACGRTVRFYNDFPRIDFETNLNDVPNRTVVVAEFPLAESVTEVRRGIPGGFSHGAWDKPNPNLNGWTKGIVPAVRWSHYTLAGGGGVALLDRGLSGRELNGATPILYLLNAVNSYYGYPNSWLSGKGRHHLEYALVAHESDWKHSRIPQMAWEYNSPPVILNGSATAAAQSFLQTSENVVVEAMRREGSEIELRLVECLGLAGTAEVTLTLPHTSAATTDLTGSNAKPIKSGPRYIFPIRPQQIVTMRFRTVTPVAEVKPLMKWDELVPESKRAMLNEYSSEKGHPPRGN